MKLKIILFQVFFVLLFVNSYAQNTTLVINELSQGTGQNEYVEFLVISTSTDNCVRPTLDLRKWVFDDNSGYFKAGSGSGIAAGSMRFADNPFWKEIPAGTLILIYNASNYNNALIPAADNDLNDGNCRLIIPSNSNLLEKNSLPAIGNSTIPTSGWTTGGDWATVAMRNDGDAFQVYNPNNLSTPVHSVSYGDNTLHQDIYFAGAASGLVYSFKNIVSDDYHNQNNWVSQAIAGNETPGLPNNNKNENYILSQSHNCSTQSNSTIDLQTSIIQNTTCAKENGSVGSTITGGTSPYTYSWSNGGNSSQLDNIGSGDYTLIVEDANGCKDTSTVHLPTSPAGPNLTLTTQPTTCGQNNGSVISNVSGGVQPYSFSWSNGNNNANLTNIPEGDYSLTVTDQQGCNVTQSAHVNNSASLSISDKKVKDASCGSNDGSIQFNIDGGVSPYTYNWSNGVTSATNENLVAGTYSVTITDQSGCSITENFNVQSSTNLNSHIEASNSSLNEGESTDLTVLVSGGNAPYTYQWSPSESLDCEDCQNVIASPTENTTYTVTVTSDEGCIGTSSISINYEKLCGEVFIPNVFSPNNDGTNDFFLIQGKCIISGKFFILNRWGEIVYRSEDVNDTWDGTFRGKDVATGVYFYQAELELEDEGTKHYSGSITLTR